MQEAGQATIAYFYFDFKDIDKRDLSKALASLLSQLSASSDCYCDILSYVHQAHINEAHKRSAKPNTETMTRCFKEMLALPDKSPVYIILDALDECPDNFGLPSARGEVLGFLKGLVGAQLPNFHLCVTSRLEIDIRAALGPLASYTISIHDQNGQKEGIEEYIRSSVYSDSRMKRWREEEKEWVIDALSERADGM